MDSVSHIRVANLLMDYVEQTCGVTFDPSGFVYGNLKPDHLPRQAPQSVDHDGRSDG